MLSSVVEVGAQDWLCGFYTKPACPGWVTKRGGAEDQGGQLVQGGRGLQRRAGTAWQPHLVSLTGAVTCTIAGERGLGGTGDL